MSPSADLPASARRRPTQTLAEACAQGVDNCLLLRFVAASMVIDTHSYPRSGTQEVDLFVRSGWDTDAGGIAVSMFFCISGFLVTNSLVRWHDTVAFLKARALRLFPAYAVCLLICAYVIGPMVTTLPLGDYLQQPATHSYVPTNLGLRNLQWKLPGVFASVPYADVVNGSIWTLPAEASMYLWLAALGLLGLFRRTWLATCVLVALIPIGHEYWRDLPMLTGNPQYMPFAGLFTLGSLAYLQRQYIPLQHVCMAAVAAIAWASHGSALYPYCLALAEAYFCFWFAYCLPWHGFSRFGDYSYGIYLWGFPCEQLAALWFGHAQPWQISLVAFPMALLLAIASWHLIERRALRLKKWTPFRQLRVHGDVSQEPG